jgi:hypothetical protein
VNAFCCRSQTGAKYEAMTWRIAAASAIGTSHQRTDLPCQDSLDVQLVGTLDGDVLVCAVADGAGTATHAEIGSEAAVKTVVRLVRESLGSGVSVSSIERKCATSWLFHIQSAIQELAEQAARQSRDYACTLLVAIIAAESAAFFQIGDGAMVIPNEADDEWSYIFWPQHGEFANSTNFITSSNAAEVLEFVTINRRIDRFAAFSDGIENLVLHNETRTTHSPFFTGMVGPVEQTTNIGLDEELSNSLSRYLSSERICDRTDDDKTLVLASRRGIMIQSPSDAFS